MVFQKALRVRGEVSPPHWGEVHDEKFCYREKFLSIEGTLRSDFDYSNFFSKLKATFCKYLTSVVIKTNITMFTASVKLNNLCVQQARS